MFESCVSLFSGEWFWFLVFLCLLVVGCWSFLGLMLFLVVVFACVYICSLLANGKFCSHDLKEFVHSFICIGSGVGSDEA